MMLMFIFGAWNLCTLKNIKQPRPGPTQQLVSVPTQAFHSDCWLPLLQAAITSTCHGVDLRRWLEGRQKKTTPLFCGVAKVTRKAETHKDRWRIKVDQRDPKVLIFLNFGEFSCRVYKHRVVSIWYKASLQWCLLCCSFFVFNQEFYGFKNVTETAIIVWSCALKQ